MNKISIIITYFNQPAILRKHLEYWKGLCNDIKDNIEFIIVDDFSLDYKAEYVIKDVKDLDIKLYKLLENRGNNSHGCRNLGALVASNNWLLFTDIDHFISKKTFTTLLDYRLNNEYYYTFSRIFSNGELVKMHLNSFLIDREKYWGVGGYDEDFVSEIRPVDDSWFISLMNKSLFHNHLAECFLEVWDNKDISDAVTVKNETVKQAKIKFEDIINKKKNGELDYYPTKPVRFKWKRVI